MCTERQVVLLVAARYGPCEIGDLQDRMKRAVALLGPKEVKNIMREEGKIEVKLQGLNFYSSACSPNLHDHEGQSSETLCMLKSCNACPVYFRV